MAGEANTWFAGESGAFLLFRVNRRPLPEISLFGDDPGPVFEHFRGVLAPGWEVVTGRRHQRSWKVGGVHADPQATLLTGKLGWLPRGQTVVPAWSEEDQDWVSSLTAPAGGQVMPFGFDGETRLLAVLHDGSSAPPTIAGAFQKILQQNEAQLPDKTTDWAVEPILDRQNFIDWLEELDVVRSVSFTAKLPNPEPEGFNELADRLAHRNADRITETMRARRNGGLTGVQDDRDFRQAIHMAESGFATLRGRGTKEGRTSKYSQNEAVARERVDDLPPTWGGVFDLVGTLLKDRLRRFLDGKEPA